MSVNDLLNEALTLWAKIFSIDIASKSWSGALGEWRLRTKAEELNASRDLDPTGLTTFMMLKALLDEQLQGITVRAIDFLRNRDKVLADMEPLDDLLTLLEDEKVVALVEQFRSSLKAAADLYGADMTKVSPYLDNLWNAAHVVRDAYRSMEILEAHQFTQGDPESEELGTSPHVYEFWNINSLIRAMQAQMVPGITLCLIRDPMALHSYFVFAIKNGDTITILTDRSPTAHPLQKTMSRRPDRELENRAFRNHFPYNLLELEISEDQKHMWAKARTSLVPTSVEAVKLADIKDLGADTIVWLTLVFELIRERYGRDNHQLPQLSYTGEMVADPHSLIGETGTLVQSGKYKPLELGTLAQADLADTIEDNWNHPSTEFNQWMIDRYGPQVPEEAFNLVGDRSKQLLLPTIESGALAVAPAEEAKYQQSVALWGSDSSLVKNPHLPLEALDPMGFGSREDLAKDRIWTARYNQAKVIQRLANQEYAEQRSRVLAWYTKRVRSNATALTEAAVRGELILPTNQYRRFPRLNDNIPSEQNALSLRYSRLGDSQSGNSWVSPNYMGWAHEGSVQIAGPSNQNRWGCIVTEAKSTIFALIKPTCPEALAVLCGCEVGELPIFLQHWYSEPPYSGNHILDRLDPADWALYNPWMRGNRSRGLRLTVGIAMSKSGWHRTRKRLGLPRIKPQDIAGDVDE